MLGDSVDPVVPALEESAVEGCGIVLDVRLDEPVGYDLLVGFGDPAGRPKVKQRHPHQPERLGSGQ